MPWLLIVALVILVAILLFLFPLFFRHHRRNQNQCAFKRHLAEGVAYGKTKARISITAYDRTKLKDTEIFFSSECPVEIGSESFLVGDEEKGFSFHFIEEVLGVSKADSSAKSFTLYVYPKPQKQKQRRSQHKILFEFDNNEDAQKWRKTFQDATVATQEKNSTTSSVRKYLVLVNPTSGKKKAKEIWTQVQHMFDVVSDYIQIHKIETTHAGHAGEIVKTFDLTGYNGIVVVSGDGLLHEVLNAMLHREDKANMIENIALAAIPAGSGNGLAASVGLIDDYEGAALKVIKGRTIPMDVFAVTQGEKVIYGSLMVSYGFVSDCDFESETFRFMGEARYDGFATYLWLLNRAYPVKLTLHVAENDTENGTLCKVHNCSKCSPTNPTTSKQEFVAGNHTELNTEHTKKLVIEEPITWLTACNMHYVGGALAVGPYAHLSDGLLDVTLIRRKKLQWWQFCILLLTLDSGNINTFKMVEYYKVNALELETTTNFRPQSKFDIDGEAFPSNTKLIVKNYKGLLQIIC